jgi:predicted metalloprotease with PDZ domain
MPAHSVPPPTSSSALHYRITPADLHAHLFHVSLTIPHPAAGQEVALPVWIPGSYLVREFAKNLQKLTARQGRQPVHLLQLDKARWQADCTDRHPLVLEYEVYALDNSVRTAWLDADRGFFNGTSLCLQVRGQEHLPHELSLASTRATRGWHVATGLDAVEVDGRGFGRYRAHDYDSLVDHPFELGMFWSGEFTACGVPHRFVVAGALPSFDGEKLLSDVRKICETEIRFWHPRGKPPHQRYVFMLNAVDDGYGGLEHRNSTALICARRDLPRLEDKRPNEGYTTLLGLISHEYFHTWNVKRLRPAAFAQFDYSQENYTPQLWFFEGFTSYYDDLLLRRAGLIDDATYLRLLNKTINQVLQSPGRQVQTVAQASFDAWVKYYRQDENTPNATVSYYTKGALVALCLDLRLRSEGRTTLDAVMRTLFARCKAGPMQEQDLRAVLLALGGRSFDSELDHWVHSTEELPLQPLLEQHGIAVHDDPAQPAQRLGLRVAETHGILVKAVLRGGAAEQAGFCPHDEWLGVEVDGTHWRLHKLDELALVAGPARQMFAWVARDKRMLRLPLRLPQDVRTWRLAVRDAAVLGAWLAPQHGAGRAR